jgi:hypothetical protein
VSTPSTGAERSRDLRDRPLGRIALVGAVLAVAFLSARACQGTDNVSSERAIEIARAEVAFAPDRTQVRLVQQGIPPRAYWAVSLYDVDSAGRPTRVQAFLVDRKTGQITRAA